MNKLAAIIIVVVLVVVIVVACILTNLPSIKQATNKHGITTGCLTLTTPNTNKNKKIVSHRVTLTTTHSRELQLVNKPDLNGISTAAYNASTLDCDGTIIYCFRVSSFTRCPLSTSEYYYKNTPSELSSTTVLQYNNTATKSTSEVVLDIPLPSTQSITLSDKKLEYVPGYEDARIVLYRDHIILLANARSDETLGKSGMYLIHVCHKKKLNMLKNGHKCRVVRLVASITNKVERESYDEKNWSPLVYRYIRQRFNCVRPEGEEPEREYDELYLVYSISPTIVLKVPEMNLENLNGPLNPIQHNCRDSGDVLQCHVIPSTSWNMHSIDADSHVLLPDGNTRSLRQLRGGTQLIPGKYSTYVGIGHFRSDNQQYYSVPYLLNKDPPFQLLAVGKPTKLQEDAIEYPCGLRRDKDGLVVTFGVNDCSAHEASIRVDYKSPLPTHPNYGTSV